MSKIFSKTLLSDLGLLMVALVWGGGFVVTKNALSAISPLYFLAVRFTLAGLLMVVIFNKQLREVSFKDIKNGSIIGLLLSFAFITQTIGTNFTTPAKSSFITGLNVVMVPFIVLIVTRKMPKKKAFVNAVIAFVGLALITMDGSFAMGLGDLLTLLCAFGYASHIVSVGIFAGESNAYAIATIQIVFSSIICTLLAVVFEPFPNFAGPGIWPGVIYVTILSTFAAFIIQNVAQRHTPSTHAALILCLESVFGALFSALFWHEILTPRMILGCILIFGAILVTEVDFMQFFRKKRIESGTGS